MNGEGVSAAEVALDFDGSMARGEGLRVNGPKVFGLKLSGRECYSLLNLLESYAVKEEGFGRVRCLVLWNEKIRAQLREQGF